ncbi:zinc ABC transporter substrate-binding protein [Tropicimonas sp. IMCC34043]|uniref:zinc ABC transporter substrate-binding protein n=1 Tax=Tropicimonas sp. IMCC34043 TaxID=2248760 RepID=UPI000E25E24F|nr:zinc ABC transporter substrate-binding protein [Tropicimonas sp. IMCC34043]
MRQSIPTLALTAMLSASAAFAEVPKVATDIAPVQSLAAQVMAGLGAPELILPPGASPHGYSMRPSEARSLADADLVFWVGEALTPWLEKPLESLAGNAEVVELAEVPGVTQLSFREGAAFAPHDHDAEEEHVGDQEPPDEEGHAHSHHGLDPHMWLDPDNAKAWLMAMAEALAAADPDNAATYRANAAAAVERLGAEQAQLAAELAPVQGMRFILFHDAFQYFEHRFGLTAAGAISLGDAVDPGAARVTAIRDLVRDEDIACVAAEPQFSPALVATVTEGTGAKTTVLDPIGVGLNPGPEMYGTLLQNLAQGFLACR